MSNHIALSQVIGDVAAGSAVIGSLAGYLPEIAAGMAIIYYLIQFYRWLRADPPQPSDEEDVDPLFQHRRPHRHPGADDDSSGPAP